MHGHGMDSRHPGRDSCIAFLFLVKQMMTEFGGLNLCRVLSYGSVDLEADAILAGLLSRCWQGFIAALLGGRHQREVLPAF